MWSLLLGQILYRLAISFLSDTCLSTFLTSFGACLPDRNSFSLDTVGTVYHLVIYMQSNKIHKVILMSKFYSALMLARHVSDLIGPSSGAFCTSCNLRLWYVVIRVLLDTSSRYKVVGRWTDEVRNMSC